LPYFYIAATAHNRLGEEVSNEVRPVQKAPLATGFWIESWQLSTGTQGRLLETPLCERRLSILQFAL
jgi:hypothetical protein